MGKVRKDLHFRPSQSLSRSFLMKYLFKTQQHSFVAMTEKWLRKTKELVNNLFLENLVFFGFLCASPITGIVMPRSWYFSLWCELKAILWTKNIKTFVLDAQKWQIQPDIQTLGAVPWCWKQRWAGSTQRCPADRNLQNQLQPGSSYTAQKITFPPL